MPLLYGRRIEVEIAGLKISEPRIAVELERSTSPSQDKGWVAVYNLRDNHSDRIYQRGREIVVRAGYPETIAIVFQGTVQRIVRVREQLAFITKIELGDEARSSRRLSGSYSESFEGQYPSRDIAVDIISRGLGLLAGPLDAIPENATFNNYYWAGGPATAALAALLRPLGLTFYEADGVVRVNRPGHTQSDAPAIRKDSKTGLVGTVTITDEGAEARMFLEPRLALGSRVEVDDGKRQYSGKCVLLRHVADNWEASSFVTFCELRPLS